MLTALDSQRACTLAHLHNAIKRMEGKARKWAHLVPLIVLVVDNMQPTA